MAELGKQHVANKGKEVIYLPSYKQIIFLEFLVEFAIKVIFWKTNDYVVKYITAKIQMPVSTCKMKHMLSPLRLHETF